MPTYEFTCRVCQQNFEVFTSISKKCEIACTVCGSQDLQEVFGVFYVGGNVSNPGAGMGSSCDGSCATCSSKCEK